MKYFSSQNNIFKRKKIMFENSNISENNIIIVKATKELQQSLVSIS
jgi:5'(3')-deoxyribonucleotidase